MTEHECRHCGKRFVALPGKAGFVDECPVCVEERLEEERSAAESAATAELLKESIRDSALKKRPRGD
jgi:uncharacterized Zn finger protein (UPF0148 family)